MNYFLISRDENIMINGHHYIFEENMYSKSACGFIVAIPLLWILHLNNFTKRYILGAFHFFCFICNVVVLFYKQFCIFFKWTANEKGFYTKESKLYFMRCPLYNIRITISVNSFKNNGVVFYFHTFLGGKSHF